MPVAAISQALALLLLFVVLPFVVAGAVIAFVSWRSEGGTPPVLTSDVIATGQPGVGTVLSIKQFGGFADPRPMVRFGLRITMRDGSAPFDLDVTQSFPRNAIRALRAGDIVEVRVTSDHAHGAVIISEAAPE